MSQGTTSPSDFGGGGLSELVDSMDITPIPPTDDAGGSLMRQTHNGIITAQKVDQPRDYKTFAVRLGVMAAQFGPDYVYAIPFYDSKLKRQSFAEGLTIKGAMDLAREYGNCQVDIVEIEDLDDSWVFHARFVDLETGFSLTRPFMQNKSRKTAKNMERGRQEENLFLIGVSKAIRNVVTNSLRSWCKRLEVESKRNVVGRVAGNREGALKEIFEAADELGISTLGMGHAINEGDDVSKWTNAGIAALFRMIETVRTKMASVEDIFPIDDAKPVNSEVKARKTTKATKKSSKAKAATNPVPIENNPPEPVPVEPEQEEPEPILAATAKDPDDTEEPPDDYETPDIF